MASFEVVTCAKLLAIATILHGNALYLLIILRVKSTHHVCRGALDSAIILASYSASCTLTQISVTSLNLSVNEVIVCEAKSRRFEIALFTIRVHSSAHIACGRCRYSMLHMMWAITCTVIDELCRGSLALIIYIAPSAGMLRISDLKLWLVLHELILLGWQL